MKFILLLFSSSLLLSCQDTVSTEDPKQEILDGIIEGMTVESRDAKFNLDSLILSSSQQILQSIMDEKWGHFASYIHPIKGIRFSPYAYIDTKTQIILFQNTFLSSMNTVNSWGTYDGSGEEIKLTTKAYFKKFVYNADFLKSDSVVFNRFIGSGNSLNNLKKVYSKNIFTEHYFKGFDPKYEGMDWTALRLVFEEYNGSYFLVGIVHDQWTI